MLLTRSSRSSTSSVCRAMAGAPGQLLDVEVPVLGKLPHRLRRVREERGFGAQQPFVPPERALVVAYRKPRAQVDRHAFTLTPRPRGPHAEKDGRLRSVPAGG